MSDLRGITDANAQSRISAISVCDTWQGYVLGFIEDRKRELRSAIDTGSRLDAVDSGIKILALDALAEKLGVAEKKPEPAVDPGAEPEKRSWFARLLST